MLKFVIDEDMPRSTANVLKSKVFKFAQKEKAAILTGDLGFGNLLHFPVGSHSGIVIAHFPNEISTSELNKHNLTEADFNGSLIIIEPGKIRIRRK